jgi:hypothetical protein
VAAGSSMVRRRRRSLLAFSLRLQKNSMWQNRWPYMSVTSVGILGVPW